MKIEDEVTITFMINFHLFGLHTASKFSKKKLMNKIE